MEVRQNDQFAAQLSMLEIKRDRTMADLDAVQAASQSVARSMESYQAKHNALNEQYLSRLDSDNLSEEERLALYREWNEAFQRSVDEYNQLAAERERLHMQEIILVRMLAELDHQINVLKANFA
ncbi:MAG: hypothetical protein WBH90_05095 [Aggregatilineales bacterium]|nr:hypothetical protein [Aggregatilineales bacterium]HPV07736.1 hypothetical protein [Aggregatilineales bacterium]HQE17412.1 hypothetical protein [Aggregatilineales bacterium]